jgi:Holliday junction DNA helicase RuvB
VQLLLLNLGIVAHRTRKQRAGSAFWCLFIGGRDAERFHDLVGCRLTRKRMRAEQVNARPRGWSRGDIYWDQVSAVEESTAATFDFVVPGAHSFVANGFFNHNTTLSHILANEMSGNLKVTAGPAIEKAGDLAAILTNLRKGDILFIDEIHRLRTVVEEILYPAMEDFALDIVVGSGPGARNIRLNLPKFTIVGATTRLASITAPLRARFGVVERFDFYEPAAIEKIVTRAAQLLNVQIEPDAAQELSRRSRGTPRVGLRLLRRVRDFALVRADGRINLPVAEEALSMMLQIDWLGLDDLDRRVLEALIIKFNGGPVGLDTLAASISEEADTIMDVVEPYLLQLGFLDRTPRGRTATRGAYNHLGIDYPERPEQPGLFGLPKTDGNG